MKKFVASCIGLIAVLCNLQSQQPAPCGAIPAMTSECATACVICDIDGFTGINDLTAPGQLFPEFCTTQGNNVQYIAFIAGSVDLTVRVDVGNCVGGINTLEVGFFESSDCENFTPITICDTDIPEFTSQEFVSLVPLTIGQHYYLVIDGSNGANCEWTFNVLAGSTAVNPLTTSGIITAPEETCPGMGTTFSTTGEVGAASYSWTVDGAPQVTTTSLNADLFFQADGTYEVCVTGSNACDEAPPTCTTIRVRTPGTFNINERLCDGECIEANGVQYCQTGVFQEIVTLPNGCDSTINIDIEVLPVATSMLSVLICNDTVFTVGDEDFNITGTYVKTVLTADECDSIVTLDLQVIECEIIGDPDEIPVICNGTASGTLIFSVDQGEAPLTFTYSNIADPTITGTGMTNLLINNEIPGIPAGTYQIYISDDFGNDVVVLQEVTEPPVLGIGFTPSDFGGFNTSCFESNGEPGNDGSLTAEISGGVPPYDYLWSDGQDKPTAENLLAQEYLLTVTDGVGCSMISNYTLIAPPILMSDVDFRDPNCDGFETGMIEVIAVAGGTADYVYALNNGDFQDTPLFSGLLEGSYEVQVMDANGCIEIIASEIVAPEIPVVFLLEDETINLGDEITIVPFLNIDQFQNITWTDSTTLNCGNCLEPIASPVNNTTYQLMVTSIDGCTVTDEVQVKVTKTRRVYIPNAFSPNNDGNNDFFTVFGGKEVQSVTSLRVFSRWGAVVFENENFPANELSEGWDGRINGRRLNPDTYAWTAEIEFIDGISISYRGDITILK